MKKLCLIATLILFTSSVLFSQINYAAIYDPHLNSNGARYFPSRLGTTFKRGEVNLVNVYGWLSNNAVGYKYMKGMIYGNEINVGQVKDMVGQLKGNNNVFFGADVQVLNAAFKINSKKKKKEVLSMEIGHRERIMGNLQFNKNLMKIILEGNKQFANQNISLSDVRANAIYSREFLMGFSVPIKIVMGKHSMELRPAARGKFLLGIANVYTEKGKAEMFTEAEGRYIDFNYDYKFSHSISTSGAALASGNGYGWGLDMGAGVTLDDNISVDVGLIDIGAIKFTKNTQNYQRKGLYHYDGVELIIVDKDSTNTIGFDINDDILNPEKSNNAYTTPYGMKLTLRAEYRMKKSSASKKDSTHTYYQHHFFVTYVQGFDNIYNTTKVPNFSVGYMYSLKDILNVGLSLGFLGYNKVSIGPFLSVKGGPFVIGFGSNNLMAFIAPKVGTGADAYFNIGFNF